MTSRPTVWSVLGIEPTQDETAIRRAYARQLKVTRPEDDAEGFQRLRTAYEFAIHHARRTTVTVVAEAAPTAEAGAEPAAASPAADDLPPSAAIEAPEPIAVDPALAELESSFDALQHSLLPNAATTESTRLERLNQVLTAPALSNVTTYRYYERALADLLLSTAPQSDPLLIPTIEHFRWWLQEGTARADPTVLAVLARRRDLAFEWELQEGKTPAGRSYQLLKNRQHLFKRLWHAYMARQQGHDVPSLLARISDHHRGLLDSLDAQEVAWWRNFETGLRPSRTGVRLAALLMGILGIVGFITGAPDGRGLTLAALGVFGTLAAFAALISIHLFGIERPTRLIAQRLPDRPPAWLLLGWFPLCLLAAPLMAIVPLHPAFVWIAGAIAVVCGLWAIYLAGPLGPAVAGNQIILANTHIGSAVLLNVVLFEWWHVVIDDSWGQRTIAALGAMCAWAFGSRVLERYWFERLVPRQRYIGMALFVAAAGLVGTFAWIERKADNLQVIIATLIVVLVLVHRVARSFGSGKAGLIIQGVLLFGGLMVAQWFIDMRPDAFSSPKTTIFGLTLLIGAVVGVAFGALDEYRARTIVDEA